MSEQKTRPMKTWEVKFYDLKTGDLKRTVQYQSTCRPTNWARHQRQQGEDSSIKEVKRVSPEFQAMMDTLLPEKDV